MSDAHHSAGDPATPGHPPYDRPAKPWARCQPKSGRRGRYLAEAETELRVQALLDRAEAALRSGDSPVTIRTLWMALADRVGRSDDGDLRAAAALAGMAMGLRPP